MHHPSPAATLADRIDVHGTRADVTEELRAAAMEEASRLFAHSFHIDRIRLEFDEDPTRAPADRFMVKGQIEFGGPALLASVASDDPLKSLRHLIAKFDHLLRRYPR